MRILRQGTLFITDKFHKWDVMDEDGSHNGWVWTGSCWQSPAGADYVKKSIVVTNSERRGGIDPRTGLQESYIGLFRHGRLLYKKAIAEALGLEDEDHAFEQQLRLSKDRVRCTGRTKRVFPRKGTPRDPGGFVHEDVVRKFWQAKLVNFEDYTADGSEAIGADFRGTDPTQNKIVYVEAQPVLHDLTHNEHQGVVKADAEGALYVIHTRRGWGYVTPTDFEEIIAYRLTKRFE